MAVERNQRAQNKEELVLGVFAERDELVAAVEELPDNLFDEDLGNGDTVRRILSHSIVWDDRSISDATLVILGGVADMWPDEDNDRFNAEAFERYRDVDSASIVERFLQSTTAVKKFLSSQSEADLFRTRGQVFIDNVGIAHTINAAYFFDDLGHDSGHAREIREFRARVGR